MNVATTSFLTFGLAGEAYAIPLTRVREVVTCRSVVRVPNAAATMRGVMNLRGSVIPVIDFGRCLGVGATSLGETTCAVLIEADIDGDHAPLAWLVEEIHSVVELADEEVVAAPSFGLPVNAHLVRGITPQGDRFAYVLDLDQVLTDSLDSQASRWSRRD